jgi:hypothetical protein
MTTQLLILACLGIIWSGFWLWIDWMLFKVLRWTYVEKRAARPVRTRQWTPPVSEGVKTWQR